ncbi:MAG: thioredoxin TrxC [Deltaproteobacteria bacterium]|jgi:thioredoxin 2|nr:thioredoxin TrxC [Deltaproteobacteria bacterium]MCW9050377.1 thioredoxin TrxC [Deltaproteobacteria bacterium]
METVHIVCPHCLAVNRLPQQRLDAHPKCGKCAKALFTGQPVELTRSSYQQHLLKNDIPLLIDCWAPWCGPCKMMGPAFAEAAKQLEPGLRLAKINTEIEQQLGAQLNVRSIPTLILLHRGQERARQSGAMNSAGIIQWVKSQSG